MTVNAAKNRISGRGLALALVLALIGASGFREARLELGPLLVHPYLVPMFALFAMAAIGQLHRFPRDLLVAIAVFVALYALATLPAPGAASEILKVVASFTTVVACALCVRTRRDFWAAVLGLNVAGFVLTIKGLAAGMVAYAGYNPLEDIANKNAFSLYALPPVLLGGFVILDPGAPRRLRLALLVCVLLMAFDLFSGANRSGWLGLLLIAFGLAVRGQRVKGTLVMGAIAGLTYLLLTTYGSTKTMEYRIEQTQEGYHSDVLRERLVSAALDTGWDNPFTGVTPQRLPVELARRLKSREHMVDPHNVLGHVVGGAGLLCGASFLWLGVVAWKRPRVRAPAGGPAHLATHLMRLQLVLFAVRGMFSREILYSPAFAASFGLAIGLCLIEYGALARPARAAASAPKPASATRDLLTGAPESC